MAVKKKTSENGNGLRDYSHLPRLKDLPKPKTLTLLQKELKKATREWLKAMEKEERKYGISHT
jgi:hypothetical protein